MNNNKLISSEDWVKAMKNSARYPQVRPDDVIDSDMWLDAARKADNRAPRLLDEEKSETQEISLSIVCLLISIPVWLVLSYVYNGYLSFLTIPTIIALYLYERKNWIE